MRDSPLASIIIPTFNSSKTIEQCLESCLMYAVEFEIIVQDGGSNDDTINRALSVGHPKMILHSEKDNGVYDAMNKAIYRSNGRYLFFLGSDDILTEGFLDIIGILQNEKYDILYAQVRLKYRDIVINEKTNFNRLLFESNLSHQGIFYNRKLFENKLYNLNFPIYADYRLNLKLWADRKIKKKFVEKVICVFNDEDGLTGQNTPDMNFHEYRERLRKRVKEKSCLIKLKTIF